MSDEAIVDEPRGNGKRWTPMRGLRKAVIWGSIATAVLAIALAPVAHYTPHLLISFWVRMAIAFAVAWVLFSIVHGAAGMTGGLCTALAVILSLAVMYSNHFVWEFAPLQTADGPQPDAGPVGWLHPVAFFAMNISAFFGIGVCAAFSKNGVPGPDFANWLFTTPLYGRTR